MNERQYHVEHAVEADHWWYKQRRTLLADTLHRMALPAGSAVLDAGCGTGSNLRVLRERGFSQLSAFDYSQKAVTFCREKGFDFVTRGDIHCMAYADRHFDLVISTDTLAYLDDRAAVREMRRVLRPGGTLLLTAPALMALWGQNDSDIGHKRRYDKQGLSTLLDEAGFRLREIYYFNYLLFPPIWLTRKINNALGPRQGSESEMTPAFVNTVLSGIFYLDIKTARFVRPPAGVSLMAIAQRP